LLGISQRRDTGEGEEKGTLREHREFKRHANRDPVQKEGKEGLKTPYRHILLENTDNKPTLSQIKQEEPFFYEK